jgi:hypothetical protein
MTERLIDAVVRQLRDRNIVLPENITRELGAELDALADEIAREV